MELFKVVQVNNDADSPVVIAASNLMASLSPWTVFGMDAARAAKLLSDKTKTLFASFSTEDSSLQGIMLLDTTGPFKSYIHILCIAEKWQGKGLAKLFIATAEQIAFKLSPNVFICVSDFNPRARKLYESLGFEECGVLKDYIIKGKNEILLRKTIGTRVDFNNGLIKYP